MVYCLGRFSVLSGYGSVSMLKIQGQTNMPEKRALGVSGERRIDDYSSFLASHHSSD